MPQQHFDALVIFQYNTGGLKNSTLKTLINTRAFWTDIEASWKSWNLSWNESKKARVVIQGLVNRRADEWEIWRYGDYKRTHFETSK